MTIPATKPPRIVFIGASGEMCRIVIGALAKAVHCDIVLADIRPEIIRDFAKTLNVNSVQVLKLDLFDKVALDKVVRGSDLVVLGAGPYQRTSTPVIEGCIAAKVAYLDFDDDVESTEHAISLSAQAKAAGIPLFVGCGASPGLTNILAVDAANDLDKVHRIDVTWLVGHERTVGRAVLEHMVHIAADECATWEGGRRVVHQSMVATEKFPILPGQPDYLLYETAHPEPVTLARKYPMADRIRCYGGLDPMCQCGLSRGLALAVKDGRLTFDEAVDLLLDVANGGMGNIPGWKAALSGAFSQIRRGETTWGSFLYYLWAMLIGKQIPYRGGLMAQAYGTKDGKPAESGRRVNMGGPLFNDLGGATGLSCAAFAILALEAQEKYTGTLCPEDWAEPKLVYAALERVGVPRDIVHKL